MAWCWLLDLLITGDLSHAELCLCIVLQRHLGSNPTCFPSITTLSKELRLTRQWTNDLILQVEKKGFIGIERRRGRGHIYRLIKPAQPANSTLQPPVNSTLQVAEADLSTPLDKGCKPELAGGANSTLHKLDLTELDQLKETTQRSSSVSKDNHSNNGKNPKKPADPRVKQLIDYFCTAYQQRLDSKYIVSKGKDGQHFKDILAESLSPETLQGCIDLFLVDTDQYLDDKPRSIGMFRARINNYLRQLNQATAAPIPAAHRRLE